MLVPCTRWLYQNWWVKKNGSMLERVQFHVSHPFYTFCFRVIAGGFTSQPVSRTNEISWNQPSSCQQKRMKSAQ